MSTFGYLKVQIKRAVKKFYMTAIICLIFSISVFAVAFVITEKSELAGEKEKFTIGIVGAKDNKLLEIGFSLLKNFDQTKYVIDFKNFNSEEKARNALFEQTGQKIIAYVVIPKEFADSLYYLENDCSVTYFTNPDVEGISSVVMDEIAKFASNLILYTETGIYTLIDFMKQNHFSYSKQDDYINTLFAKYVKAILKRGNLISVNELGISNGVSLISYYFCAILLLYTLLLSFSGITFFSEQSKDLKILLRANGISSIKQVISEYVGFFCMNFLSFLIIAAMMFFLFITGLIRIPEFGENQLKNYFVFILKFVPILLSFSMFEMFLFEMVDGLLGQLLTCFLVIFSFSFASGYFYPQNFLPQTMRNIGKILPTGPALAHSTSQIKNHFSAGPLWHPVSENFAASFLPLFGIFAYFAIFFALTCVLRKVKISSSWKKVLQNERAEKLYKNKNAERKVSSK